jgi:hypothetical protein
VAKGFGGQFVTKLPSDANTLGIEKLLSRLLQPIRWAAVTIGQTSASLPWCAYNCTDDKPPAKETVSLQW